MDQKLFLLLNRVWVHPAADRFMAAVSSFDAWLPVFILAGLWAAWRGGFRARAFLLTVVITVAISDGLVSNTLKRLVNRPRPADVSQGVRQVDLAKARPRLLALAKPPQVKFSKTPRNSGPGRSFPSSHTANTMAAAMLAALFFPRRGWLALLAALAVAYSRIYTGSHWPSDVLASSCLGLGLAFLGALAAEGLWRRLGPRWAPSLAARYPSLFAPSVANTAPLPLSV